LNILLLLAVELEDMQLVMHQLELVVVVELEVI
jgi:hypothetical protein